ncbi:Prefoldin [Coprinopsis sp. MPI-PUGE-AT-0042]|nr:Prefoldin [Coprinopsis sp. MPI-PUGE-AT-0042]
MATTKSKSKVPQMSDQEIQQTYVRIQQELGALATKISELESEADEHTLVLSSLEEVLSKEPDRKCFRLIGGVLVERTVKDVVPQLKTNQDGIKRVIANLAEQYKTNEQEFDAFKKEYNIRPVSGPQ